MKAQRDKSFSAPSISEHFDCFSGHYTETSSRDTSNSAQPSNSNGTSSPDEGPNSTYSGGSAMSLTNITHAQPNRPIELNQYNKRPHFESLRKNKPKEGTIDSSLEATTDNMDLLALGMIRLFLRYGTESESSPSSDSPSNSARGSSETSSEFSCEKIKHELITTLRDSMPLGYLQDLCKRNDFSCCSLVSLHISSVL
ncbi:hypothetical protein DSO57_1022751 [Entomophthora muscae]|uniref:Uncharacterized protein n=1 Tax=Entomophthora muscae TaxID=34485 RepID=A0ACC2TQJ8_9FUNG|nr:hypothetical protein DSO57_1022751 [Entomophthora muscae]